MQIYLCDQVPRSTDSQFVVDIRFGPKIEGPIGVLQQPLENLYRLHLGKPVRWFERIAHGRPPMRPDRNGQGKEQGYGGDPEDAAESQMAAKSGNQRRRQAQQDSRNRKFQSIARLCGDGVNGGDPVVVFVQEIGPAQDRFGLRHVVRQPAHRVDDRGRYRRDPFIEIRPVCRYVLRRPGGYVGENDPDQGCRQGQPLGSIEGLDALRRHPDEFHAVE